MGALPRGLHLPTAIGLRPLRAVFAKTSAPSEPAWHHRARRERSHARHIQWLNAQLLRADQKLANHHGSKSRMTCRSQNGSSKDTKGGEGKGGKSAGKGAPQGEGGKGKGGKAQGQGNPKADPKTQAQLQKLRDAKAQLDSKLAAANKELSKLKAAQGGETEAEAVGPKPVEPPKPVMLNRQNKWVPVAWTCHACNQQHWSAGKKTCATCQEPRDPEAWTVIQVGKGNPMKEVVPALPGRLEEHKNFYAALGHSLEPAEKVSTSPSMSVDSEGSQASPAPASPETGLDLPAKLAKAKEVLKTLEDIGSDATKQALTKQIKEMEKAVKTTKQEEVIDLSNPLRVAQRANRALAELREDRAKRLQVQQKRKEAINEQLAKLQQELVNQEATMQQEEEAHQRHLAVAEKTVADANAKATEMGLLSAAPAPAPDAGTEVQTFQKALESVYPHLLTNPQLRAKGISPEALEWLFQGQLVAAHQLSINSELLKLNAQTATSAASASNGTPSAQSQAAAKTPVPEDIVTPRA